MQSAPDTDSNKMLELPVSKPDSLQCNGEKYK